eukprot:s3767_g8.t1
MFLEQLYTSEVQFGPSAPSSVLVLLLLGVCVGRQSHRHRDAAQGRLCLDDWKVSCRLTSVTGRLVGEVCKRRRGRGQSIVICLRAFLSTLCVFLHFLIQGQLGVDSSSREKIRFEKGCGFWKGAGQRARGLSCQDPGVKIMQDEISIDSRSEVETLAISSEDSSPASTAAPREPAHPPPPKARPRSSSPVELQTPKVSAASSSSSSRPAVAKAIAIRPAVPKAIAISSVVDEGERWDPEILRIGAEIYDRQGQLIHSVQPRIDQIPFISIDYHQVPDRCNLSRRQTLRLTSSGQLHQRVLDVLSTAAQGATLIALSCCNAEDIRQNVRTALVGLPQFRHVILSDDRINNRGKLL